MIRAFQMGPVKDLNRARVGRHGIVCVRGKTLFFMSRDGKQVSLTLDGSEDMLLLVAQLSKELGGVQMSEVVLSTMPKEMFLGDKMLHDGGGDFSYGVRI